MTEELFESILDETNFSTTRSSGPGGQNVNKVNSKVIIKWNAFHSKVISDAQRELILSKLASKLSKEGDLVISAQDSRSQLKNKEEAVKKLRSTIKRALTQPRKRKATKPSTSSRKKRVDDKKRRGEKKEWRKKLW